MPPGSAKSKYVTELFSPWLFTTEPRLQIIGASHTIGLAEDFSAKIQRQIKENADYLEYGLASDARSRWYTTNGGSYLAAGVGTGIPGFRADYAIIDDPIKGRQEADSEADRKRVWDWYLGSLERRMKPGAKIVLMHTRWHEDDLAGRLLATSPGEWTILKLPAFATETDDPLGRALGEPMWADDEYGYAKDLQLVHDSLLEKGAAREWSSQYQQNPVPAEGALFKTGMVTVLPAYPPGRNIVRAWDLAATKDMGTREPDWTAGVKLMRTRDDHYVVLDVIRFRGGPEEVEKTICNVAIQDGPGCKIGIPQDPGQAGKSQALYFTKKLSGYRVEVGLESGEKATRAAPCASQCNVGNLSIVNGGWNRAFLEELGAFPVGTFDDQVDALSRAFSMIGLSGKGWNITDEALALARSRR